MHLFWHIHLHYKIIVVVVVFKSLIHDTMKNVGKPIRLALLSHDQSYYCYIKLQLALLYLVLYDKHQSEYKNLNCCLKCKYCLITFSRASRYHTWKVAYCFTTNLMQKSVWTWICIGVNQNIIAWQFVAT